MVNFPTRILDCESYSAALLDLFISSDASICYTMTSIPLGNSDHVVVSVSIDFPSNSQWDAPFHCIAYDYSHADRNGLCDHLRNVLWEGIFKTVLLLLLVTFVSCFKLELMFISLGYHVQPHSSPWFSAAWGAAIFYRNHLFRVYQQNKSSESKVKFTQASDCRKRILEAAKLAYANKTKESINSHKLRSQNFRGKFPAAPSTKVNLLYLLYSTTRRCCLLHLINQNCLLKT